MVNRPPTCFGRAKDDGDRETRRSERCCLTGTTVQPTCSGSGDRMTVRMRITAAKPVNDFVFGISIFNAEGICCYGTNTAIEELTSETMTGEGEVSVVIDRLDLVEGTYKLDVAVHTREGRPYDYHRLLHTFRVKSDIKDVGIYRPRHAWTFTPNIRFRDPPGE